MAAAKGFCIVETAIGPVGLAWNDHGVAGAQLPDGDAQRTRLRMQRRYPGVPELPPPPLMQNVAARMRALLGGYPDPMLDVRLDVSDVPAFQQRVYEVTRAIPPGRTLTYGQVAQRIGDPGAARAVGQALGLNPFAPIVPCHRVLAANNASGGFSADGGVATKLRMLQIEKAQFGDEPSLFD